MRVRTAVSPAGAHNAALPVKHALGCGLHLALHRAHFALLPLEPGEAAAIVRHGLQGGRVPQDDPGLLRKYAGAAKFHHRVRTSLRRVVVTGSPGCRVLLIQKDSRPFGRASGPLAPPVQPAPQTGRRAGVNEACMAALRTKCTGMRKR